MVLHNIITHLLNIGDCKTKICISLHQDLDFLCLKVVSIVVLKITGLNMQSMILIFKWKSEKGKIILDICFFFYIGDT